MLIGREKAGVYKDQEKKTATWQNFFSKDYGWCCKLKLCLSVYGWLLKAITRGR